MTKREFELALKDYIDSSVRTDKQKSSKRYDELNKLYFDYVEIKISNNVNKKIHLILTKLLRTESRLDNLENLTSFENRVNSLIAKKIKNLATIIGGFAALITLILALIKFFLDFP